MWLKARDTVKDQRLLRVDGVRQAVQSSVGPK